MGLWFCGRCGKGWNKMILRSLPLGPFDNSEILKYKLLLNFPACPKSPASRIFLVTDTFQKFLLCSNGEEFVKILCVHPHSEPSCTESQGIIFPWICARKSSLGHTLCSSSRINVAFKEVPAFFWARNTTCLHLSAQAGPADSTSCSS